MPSHDDCCSCHIMPPCSYCTDHCFECKEWEDECVCGEAIEVTPPISDDERFLIRVRDALVGMEEDDAP